MMFSEQIERYVKLRKELCRLLASYARYVPDRPLKLRSGKTSNLYIDCRPVILSSQGHELISKVVSAQCKWSDEYVGALAATGMGGTFIASAAAGYNGDYELIYVRDTTKSHGLLKEIEVSKDFDKNSGTIIVDDVLTTGSSLELCINNLLQNYIRPTACVVLVDREEGGKQYIEKTYNIPVFPVTLASNLCSRNY